jgi:hypothetical protein
MGSVEMTEQNAPALPPGFILDHDAGTYREPPIVLQPGERGPLTVGRESAPQPLPPGFALDDDPLPPKPPQPSAGESFARGINQGATFNFGDELAGVQSASGLPDAPAWTGPLGTLYNVSRTGIGAGRLAAEKVAPSVFGTGGGEAYDATVERERVANEAAAQAHPWANLAGQAAGALPTALVAPEIGALKTLTPFARAALTGAGYGALSGAGAGTDIGNRANQAASGAVLGGATGGASSAAISALAPVANYTGKAVGLIRGNPATVDTEAARRIQSALSRDASMGSDGLPAAAMDPAQQAGLPVINADRGGETVKALARSSANTSPEARIALQDAINPRYANQGERINNAVRSIAGTQGDAGATATALEEAARKANRPAYAKAYAQGANGLWDEGFEQLTRAPDVQDAIRAATRTGANRATVDGFAAPKNPFVENNGALSLKKNPDGTTAYPSLQFWDHVQRNLRDKTEALARTGHNSAAADTKALRKTLVDHLDQLAPAFREARQGAARFFGAENALEAGQKFVTSNLDIREAARAFAKMSESERALFREGFVSDLTSKIERLGDSADVVNRMFGSNAARQKIQIVLGKDGAAKLEAHLRVENIMTRLRTAINGNSTTARQLAELGMAGGLGGVTQGVLTGDMDPRKLTLGFVLGAAAKKGYVRIDANVARRVGEMLASPDPKILERGLTAAAKNGTMMDALKALEKWLPSASGNIAGPRGAPALRSVTGQVPSAADENKRP